MTDSPANYHAITHPEDHRSGIHEPEADKNPDRTREWMLFGSVTKWTCFFLGCATLLPWNALTNATPFFLSRLVNSPFYSTFSSWLSSVFTFTKLLCLSYCTITSKQSPTSRRIYVSTIAAILLTASLCLSTFIRGTPLTFFSFALFNAVSLAVASSYMSAAVYSRAALLGPSFLQNVLSGQAAVAVAISAVQVTSAVISIWGISPLVTISTDAREADDGDYLTEGITARIFFGVSAVFLVMTLAAYAWLTRQAFYMSVAGTAKQRGAAEDIDELTGLVSSSDQRVTETRSSSLVYQVLKQNWVFMFSIAYVFAVTLAIYPAITVRVQPMNPTIPPVLFTAVHFLVFNVGDLVGRYICSFPRFIVWSSDKILGLSLIRTLFIPLILLCNVHQPTTTAASPTIDSDILYMLILFTVGYTNGFVACTATLAVCSPEHNPGMDRHRQDVDIAATLGATFMMVGLVLGALSSFGVEAML